ncbi:unnamed protein product [Caretta caretta]
MHFLQRGLPRKLCASLASSLLSRSKICRQYEKRFSKIEDVEAATSARVSLEKQLGNLEAEIAFLQRVHSEVRFREQAIEDLMKQSCSASACVDVSCSVPDLAPALRDIQIESEGIAAKNLQEIDEWYKTRFLDFNQPSTKHAENLRRFREEIGNCKRSLRQTKPTSRKTPERGC